MLAAARQLESFLATLYSQPEHMSPASATKVMSNVLAFIAIWDELGGMDFPKLHLLLHLCDQAAQKNPRHRTTYADENMMGAANVIITAHGHEMKLELECIGM